MVGTTMYGTFMALLVVMMLMPFSDVLDDVTNE